MGFVHKGTQHHCPGESKPVDGYPGNCRYTGGYCATHQRLCNKHTNFAYMRSKTCTLCDKVAKIAADKKKKDKKDGSGDGKGGGAGGAGASGNDTSAKKNRRESSGSGKHRFGKRPSRKSGGGAAA